MKILSKIKDIINPWKRNVDVSKVIYLFFTDIDEFDSINHYRLHSLQINNILARKEKGILHIQIELERPGLLIGKGGSTINNLQNQIEKELNCLVEINIVESTLWNFNKYKK